MGYKEELLQKVNYLKEYKRLRETNLDEALLVDNVLKALEYAEHLEAFFKYLDNPRHAVENFGSVERLEAFKSKNQGLLKGNKLPEIRRSAEGVIKLPDVDYEAIINAIEENSVLNEGSLEGILRETDPKVRETNLPMTSLVNSIKADADALLDEQTAKAVKESLDFANGEMVEKLGKNIIDDAIDANSMAPMIHAVENFSQFVHDQGLDENVVVNHNGGFRNISPNLVDPQNIETFKPFLQMEASIPEDYQQKIKGLEEAINGQDLLQDPAGGESGLKEYGLADYFEKQRMLKKALTDHAKLTDEEQKRESLKNIDLLARETQDVARRYDKVLNYIKENFDLEHVYLSGNVYSGRPGRVEDGNIDNWYPNMPPRFDFENAKAAVFLNGYTQLKSACQLGDVTLEEYLSNPTKAYMKAAENIGRKEDEKYYIPRGEENPLGKRMARALVHRAEAYNILKGYNLVGGRGMEFLTNTCPEEENKVGNTIVTNVVKEYEILFNHNPDILFGNQFEPDTDSIKNIFAFGDQEDELFKVSNSYRDKEGVLHPANDHNYEQALKDQANVPIDQQYRKIMGTIKDFALERKYMNAHLEQFGGRDGDGAITAPYSHSLGAILYAGREYFEDYMVANNLSVASIQDDALREEVTSFLTDPVGTLTSKYVKPEDLATERFEEFKHNYKAIYISERGEEAKDFIRKFNQYNQKPNGYNTGKSFSDCLEDNKGSWWERLRGKTSKQYQTLQKIGREAIREGSNIPGDNKALYSAAKAYKAYKMPEGGRTFDQLNSTEKRRIEFCDSIINAYEAQKREAAAEMENNDIQAENNIVQTDFQNQLHQDLNPNQRANDNVVAEPKPAIEKDPPEDEGVQP